MTKHIEMIIDYITDGIDFQYYDNKGILVRCKNCKYYRESCTLTMNENDYCSCGVKKGGE